jgi:hypothetical protein
MITYRELDTIRRSGRHLGVVSRTAPARLWHSMRDGTT